MGGGGDIDIWMASGHGGSFPDNFDYKSSGNESISNLLHVYCFLIGSRKTLGANCRSVGYEPM